MIESKKTNKVISKKSDSRKSLKITTNKYRHHQVETIRKFRDQHGMVLYHNVGTGKTITALSIYKQILKKNNKLKIVIIVDKSIKTRWIEDINYVGINMSSIQFIDFFDKKIEFMNLSNSLVIVDEAHNLYNLIPQQEYTKPINNLKNAYKILLLSATPFKNSLVEISYLINIAAGKKIIPTVFTEFREKYMKINKKRQLFYGNIIPISPQIFTVFTNSILAVLSHKQIISKFAAFIPTISNFIFIVIIYPLLMKNNTYNNLFDIDTTKLKHDTRPYLSYFENKDSKHFPKTKEVYHTSDYNSKQFNLLLNYELDIHSPELIDLLNENESDSIVDSLSKYSNSIEFIDKLLVIGNIKDSQKIENLIQFIKSNNNENHIIYSNFLRQGINIIKTELERNDIKYLYLDKSLSESKFKEVINKFEKTKNSILLLHPLLTEGFEIKNCRNMHILEPMSDYSKCIQLKGRVNRYNSHILLPENERDVTYHIWTCELSSLKEPIYKAMYYNKIVEFLRNNFINTILLPKNISKLMGGIIDTPDTLVKLKYIQLKEQIETIEKTFI